MNCPYCKEPMVLRKVTVDDGEKSVYAGDRWFCTTCPAVKQELKRKAVRASSFISGIKKKH